MRLATIFIPGGDYGTFATLSAMQQVVNDALQHPVILQWGQQAVDGAAERDDQIVAIDQWVRDHFTFALDPKEVNGTVVFDLITHPLAQVEMYQELSRVIGDCDDAAILTAVLGKANLIPARFRVVGFRGPAGPFSHVYTLLKGSGGWVSLDVTRPLDSSVPRVTRVAEVNV